MRAFSVSLKRSGLSACMNLKNAGELVHANGIELSMMSSDTASLISVIFSAVNGGGRYRVTSRCAVLSTTVVVAVVPVSDVFDLNSGEMNARNSSTLVRLVSAVNSLRHSCMRAFFISLAPAALSSLAARASGSQYNTCSRHRLALTPASLPHPLHAYQRFVNERGSAELTLTRDSTSVFDVVKGTRKEYLRSTAFFFFH